MTPGELTPFEKGKTYKPRVLFVSYKEPFYINVQMEDGTCSKVEVSGNPSVDVRKLKDTYIELVCTEVTDKGPEFALAPKYYEPPAQSAAPVPSRMRPIRGGQTGLKEGPMVEFKRSLIFSPQTHQPDSDQPFEIAKQIAAFMNTSGGDLFLGVDDDGFVTGIENDLPHLGEAPIMMDRVMDDQYEYNPTPDGFTTKLTTAVRCYLGTAAAALVGQPEVIPDPYGSGLRFVRIPVKPSSEVVYLGREESVVYRAQSSVLYLKGRQREVYVRERFYGNATSKPDSGQIEEILAKLSEQKKAIAQLKEDFRKAMATGASTQKEDAVTAVVSNPSIQPTNAVALGEVKKKRAHGKETNLRILYDGGRIVFNKTAIETLVQFVQGIGAARIIGTGVVFRRSKSEDSKPLFVKNVPANEKKIYTKEPISDGYHLLKKSGTYEKKWQIEAISEALSKQGHSLGITKVEIV